MSHTTSFFIRKTESHKAILFIHGFGGEAHQTFGMLPAFLAGDMSLTDWDIHCFGYPTGLFPDITGVWSADPDLTMLSGYLSNVLTGGRYAQYTEFALIAHSMGGLLVQRAILDSDLVQRVRHIILFGTPSNGLQKAGLFKIFKRQVKDMVLGSRFITSLRQDWETKYPTQLPFNFRVVAGLKDEFVPISSSINIFERKYHRYVPGNHLQMVKPSNAEEDIVYIIRESLLNIVSDTVNTIYSSSYIANYLHTISDLENKENLPTDDLVRLVLALEMVGQQDRAIDLLEHNHAGDTELTGTLAGRLKRQWLANPVDGEVSAQRSYLLYKEAFNQASQQSDYCQAFYNGINVAFLDLALRQNRYDARLIAIQVLEQCRLAPRDKWRLATEGEAQLYLGEFDYAIDCYTASLNLQPTPREIDSMYKQAIWISRLLENNEIEQRLEKLFAPFVSQ